MLPFSRLPDGEFHKLFPKEGDEYKGYCYIRGKWTLKDVCDANGKLYDEYSDNGRWRRFDAKRPVLDHEENVLRFFGLA